MDIWHRGLTVSLAAGMLGMPGAAQTLAHGTWTGALGLSNGVNLNVELAVESSGMTLNVLGGGGGPLTDARIGERDFRFMWGVFECALARQPEAMRGECVASDGTTGTLDLSAPSGGDAEAAPAQSDIPRDAVTREQLIEVGAPNLHDAIRRLRPRWLRARGETRIGGNARVAVYVNRQPMGGIDALRQLHADEVAAVWFLTAADATFEFGAGNEGGALLVVTHRRQ